MANVLQLRKFYVDNLKRKIFLEEKIISNKKYSILYLHDILREKQYFIETFSKYFPYYVWNEDQIQYIDIEKNVDENLEAASKKCWQSEVVPKRQIKSNGIYGEVLLDFYERIVHDRKLITTFASRRAFKSNYEAKGYDHIGYILDQNNLQLVIGEAKYVTTVSSAKTALIEDINGKYDKDGKWIPGHLTIQYFNEFINFIVQKKETFSSIERQEIETLIADLNKELVLGGGNFLDYIINHNMKLNCVFFAVFESKATKPEDLEMNYDNIYKQAEDALIKMNVKNFNIEIVFIPTDASSMEIKEKINEFYS